MRPPIVIVGYLLEELHANVGVILVSPSHLLHVFHSLHRLALQHADLKPRNENSNNFDGMYKYIPGT